MNIHLFMFLFCELFFVLRYSNNRFISRNLFLVSKLFVHMQSTRIENLKEKEGLTVEWTVRPSCNIIFICNTKINISNFITQNDNAAIVGALRDLRGITESTYNKRTYNLLFDALYPDAFPLLVRTAETWYDDATVMTALLKFMKVSIFNT